MSKLHCVDNVKNNALKKKLMNVLTDDMTDNVQKEQGTIIALEEFDKISRRLEEIKIDSGVLEEREEDDFEVELDMILKSRSNKNSLFKVVSTGMKVDTIEEINTGKQLKIDRKTLMENYSPAKLEETNSIQLEVFEQLQAFKANNKPDSFTTGPDGKSRRVKNGVIQNESVTSLVFLNSTLTGNTKATFLGSIIDDIAKRTFKGETVLFSDSYTNTRDKETIPYSKMFKDEKVFKDTVSKWKNIKDSLDADGYMYITDVTFYDESGLNGEADLVLVDKDGNLQISDFKTSNRGFTEENSTISKISLLTKEGEFATQGYFYAEMLKKAGFKNVKDSIVILRQRLTYNNDEGLSYKDSPILDVQNIKLIEVSYNKLRSEFKDISFKEAIEKAKALKENTNDSTPKAESGEDSSKKGRRSRKTDTLDRKVYDNIQASSNKELKKEIAEMQKLLGEEFTVKFLDEVNADVYGTFMTSQITLYKNAIQGTGYHEGFHRFTQLYLTKSEKIELYKSVRDLGIEYTDRAGNKVNTKDLTDLGIEEMLADEWAKYAQSPKDYKFPSTKITSIKTFFKALWEYLVKFFSGNPQSLFKDLYNGKYSKRVPSIDNAIWGKLNSSIINKNGEEIIHNTRVPLYIQSFDSLVAKNISDNNYSFSSVKANIKDKNGLPIRNKVFNNVYNSLLDRLEFLESKFVLPEEFKIDDSLIPSDYLLSNKKEAIENTLAESTGISEETLEMYYQQIVELNNLLYEDENGETPNYDEFVKFYVSKTRIDSIRGLDLEEYGVQNIFRDNEDLNTIIEEESPEKDEEESYSLSDEYVNPSKTYDEGANDKTAYERATPEVKDFFKTIESEVWNGSKLETETNELGVPVLLDYYSTFNKVKKVLQGSLTIEEMIEKLERKSTQQSIPYSKTIAKKLLSYYNNVQEKDGNIDNNLRFLRRFFNVMSLSEVDNYQLTVNYNALGNPKLVLVNSDVLSRNTSSRQLNSWKTNFKRSEFKDGRLKTLVKVEDFNGTFVDLISSKNYVYKNVNGDVLLNPFIDYNKEITESNYKTFLSYLGIELQPEMFMNPDSMAYVKSAVSIILTNLKNYREHALLDLMDELNDDALYQEYFTNPEKLKDDISTIVGFSFINPIEAFTRRRELKVKDEMGKPLEIYSIIPILEALAEENEYYEEYAGSGSFVNDGKLKSPYYLPSVLTSRVNRFNKISNIRDFNTTFELTPWNPNKNPWMKRSLFISKMFDESGNRQNVAFGKKYKGVDLSHQKMKIELVELSAFRTIDEGNFTNTHPRKLKGADKTYFDIISLYTNGYLEIPVAGTSSTSYALKLNSYQALRENDRSLSSNLPIVATTSRLSDSTFRSIIKGYFLGEVEKLLWYRNNKDINLSGKFLDIVTNKLNIFSDIEFDNNLIERFIQKAEQSDNINDVFDENKDMLDDFYRGMERYFTEDIQKLEKTFDKLSPDQKAVIRSLRSAGADVSQSKEASIKKANVDVDTVAETREFGSEATNKSQKVYSSDPVTLKNIATNFIMNRFILKQEFNILFMGDVYLFGGSPYKRGNSPTTTGYELLVNERINQELNKTKGERFSDITTGNTGFKNFGIIKSSLINDVEKSSEYFKVMIDDLLKYQKLYKNVPNLSEDQLKVLHDSYTSIKSGDGQGKISLDFYKTVRKVWGEWGDMEEKEYQRQLAIYKLATGNLYKIVGNQRLALTEAEIQKLKEEVTKKPYATFNPQKIAFTGAQHFPGKENYPFLPHFDKMSLAPIIPEVVYRSSNADFNYDDRLPDAFLLEEMSKNDTDYIKNVSASKIVHSKATDIYDELGQILSTPGVRLVDENSEYLHADGLRKQLNTDGMHSDDTFGSQQRKVFYDVRYLDEVLDSSNGLDKLFKRLEDENIKIIDNIIEFNRTAILKRFGINDYVEGEPLKVINPEVFSAAINDIIKNNGFPQSALEYLNYNQELQEYTFDLDLLYQRKELMQFIGGEIDRQLRRIKLKGTEAIQVTSVGNTKTRFPKGASKAQIKKFGNSGLHYYHLERDKDGNIVSTSTMGVKITLQGDFMNLLSLTNNGKELRVLKKDGTLNYKESLDNLNRALKDNNFRKEHSKKLIFYGYRIPTNNNNFLDRMEIMEFLPESAGNIIITPPEHLIKSGSDFDIDKMHLIFPSINKNGEYVGKPKESLESLYEKLYGRTKNVMSYKNEQSKIKALIKDERRDFRKVKDMRDDIFASLMEQFYSLNPALYTATVNNENLTVDDMINIFYDEISGNEVMVNKIKNYRTLDSLLGESARINNEKLLDNEFVEIFNKIQEHKDYQVNLLLENYLETLSHPAYYQLLVRPSSSSMIKTIAEEVAKLTKDPYIENYNASENSTYARNLDIHKNYRSDRNALGGFSIQRIWYSLLNRTKFKLNRNWIKIYTKDSFSLTVQTPLIPKDKRGNLIDNDHVHLYGNNIEGISPRDIYDQLMSATIDLPSGDFYTKLGIDDTNKKIFNYLIDTRHDLKSVIYFLNHPILKVLKTIYEKEKKNYKEYYFKNAIASLAEELDMGLPLTYDFTFDRSGKIDSYMTYIIPERDEEDTERPKPVLVNGSIYHIHPGVYVENYINEDTEFKTEQLKDDIKNRADEIKSMVESRDINSALRSYLAKRTPEERKRDQEILAYFMKVSLEATEMTTMKFAFSDDRNKNTNLLTIGDAMRKKDKIRGNPNNDHSVNGSIFDKRSLLKIEKDSIYKSFNYTRFAKDFLSLMYNNILEKSGNSTLAFDRILSLSNTYGVNREKLAEKILDDFTEFVYKNYGEFNETVYDPVTDKLSKNTKSFSKYFQQSIFNMEQDPNFNNYRLKLMNFLNKYPELLSIDFVSRLEPKNGARVEDTLNGNDLFDYTNITLNRGSDKHVDQDDMLYDQFQNLISFNPTHFNIQKKYSNEDMVKISAFFKELAYLSLYQGGQSNNGINNFSNLVPVRIWSNFIGQAYEKYNDLTDSQKIHYANVFGLLFLENNKNYSWNKKKISYRPERFLRDSTKSESKDDKYIEFFNNFTAGKNYLISQISPDQVNENEC